MAKNPETQADDSERRRAYSMMRNFDRALLRACSEVMLGNDFHPRKGRKDYVNDLESSRVSMDRIVQGVRHVAASWSFESDYPPPITQSKDVTFGPLGLEKSAENRDPVDARELADEILIRTLPDPHLEWIASQTLPEPDRGSLFASANPILRRVLLAQMCMRGEDRQLFEKINESVSRFGPLALEPDEIVEAFGWLLTRWGLLDPPDESTEILVAQVICSQGGQHLASILTDFQGSNDLERCATYVLTSGPADALDRFLSPASTWDFLQRLGLALPSGVDLQTLRVLVFAYVGLRPSMRPDGLFRQYEELMLEASGRGVTTEESGKALKEFKRFELCWTRSFLALLAAIVPVELSIEELMDRGGVVALSVAELVRETKRPIKHITFGQRRHLFAEILAILEHQEDVVVRLQALGRDLGELREAYCGSQIEAVIALRNALAHEHGPVNVPSWMLVRAALLQALGMLVRPGTRGSPAAIPAVRRLEEKTDSFGWIRLDLEDEVGSHIVASGTAWAEGGSTSGGSPYYLVARTARAVVRPVLVSINAGDDY